MAYLASIVPLASGAVDRLEELPGRLAFLFDYDARTALARPDVLEVLSHPGAREVVAGLAEELSRAGRVDRERFQAVAGALRRRTGQSRERLFHPIRVALTGEASGPELREAAPAIDRGADLPPASGIGPIMGCRERAAAFWSVVSGERG